MASTNSLHDFCEVLSWSYVKSMVHNLEVPSQNVGDCRHDCHPIELEWIAICEDISKFVLDLDLRVSSAKHIDKHQIILAAFTSCRDYPLQ